MPTQPSAYRFTPAFVRLAWSNLAAQSAEQISLAAVPIVAVLLLGGRFWSGRRCRSWAWP